MPPTPSIVTPTLPLEYYDAIEVYGCIQDPYTDLIERYEANEHPEADPHFWSVALHLDEGGIETIADFTTEAQADAFGELMRVVLLTVRHPRGLCTRHLKPQGDKPCN